MTIIDNRFSALGVNPKDIFLMYPHNIYFLYGKRAAPNFLAPWRDTLLALCILLVGSSIYFSLYYYNVAPLITSHFGVVADATLTMPYSSLVVKSRNYSVPYTFTIGTVVYNSQQDVFDYAYDQYYKGRNTIKIRYLPIDPYITTIVDSSLNNPVGGSLNNLVYFLIGSLIYFPVLALIVRSWQLAYRFRKAWPTASLIVGQVITCYGKVYKNNSGYPSYKLTLTYSYRSRVSSELMLMKEVGWRNDLINRSLPKPGTPVLIVSFREPIKSTNPFQRKPFQEFVL